jgi:hypothetical protein
MYEVISPYLHWTPDQIRQRDVDYGEPLDRHESRWVHVRHRRVIDISDQ